jgi:hypothetical protein
MPKQPPWLDDEMVRRIAEEARIVAESVRHIQGTIHQQALEAQRRMLEVVDSISADTRNIVGQVQSAVREVLRHIPDLEEATKQWQVILDQLPPALRDALATLGVNGWYPDEQMEMATILSYAQSFKGEADKKVANDELCRYFEQRADGILADLTRRYPNRERFFHVAFATHKEGQYEASIPLMLAQADGISQGQHQVQVYSRRRDTGELKTAGLAKKGATFERAMRLPFQLLLPLLFNEKEREQASREHGWSDHLNRHLVLHGADLSYPTQLNSFRAMSWPGYVGTMLAQDEKDRET